MHPILFTFGPYNWGLQTYGPFHLYSYGLLLAVAFAVSIPLLARDVGRHLAPRAGLTYPDGFNKTLDLFAAVIPAALIGGRFFYIVENHVEFEGKWIEVLYFHQGGLVFYGGLLGAMAAAYIVLKHYRWPVMFFIDLASPYILLGQAFGRVGCYLEGCCVGVVDAAHGVIFPGLQDGLPHLPVQLWELYGDLALFALLLFVRRHLIHRSGAVLALYAVTYGTLRYVLEFWRRDGSTHTLGVFLSPSQALSAFLVVGGLLWLLVGAFRKPAGSKPADG